MRACYLLWACLAAAAAPTLGADVYKWIDADGKVNYSDNPPPGVKSEKLLPGAPPADVEGARRLAAQEAEMLREANAQAAAAKKAEEQAAREEQKQVVCSKAQAQLKALNDGSIQLYQINEMGQPGFVDEDARKQAIGDAERAIAANCS